LVGDLAQDLELDLRPLREEETSRLKLTLPPLVTISNPLDYHTFSWGNKPALTATFAAMLACDFGMTIIVVDFPRSDICVDHGAGVVLEAAIEAVRLTKASMTKASVTGARLALVSSLVENMTESHAERLMQAGIVPLMGLRSALIAIACAARIGESYAKPLALRLNLATSVDLARPTLLDEAKSKNLLRQMGIATPQGGVVRSSEEAVHLAKEIGFPVVVKAVAQDLAHKSELAAVKLNLANEAAVRFAVKELEKISDQFLVEAMVADSVMELIIGLARDPQFGLYLTLGSGGVMVDIWQDAKILLLPTGREEIHAALFSLKAAPLLQGFRGRQKANIEAVVDVVEKIAQFAFEEAQSLEELDINPLIATPHAALAADALIRQRIC